MYMNGGMGPRGPMNGCGHGPMGGPMHGGPGMNRGMAGRPMGPGPMRGPVMGPMMGGPMYHRRPMYRSMGFFPMMGFGGLFILPILLVILSLFGGVIGLIGEAFSSGGVVFGILIGLAIYYYVKKRNAGASANTDTNSYAEYEE